MSEFEELTDLEELLGFDDRPVEWLDVPEWNKKIRLRGMTGNDLDAFEAMGAEVQQGKASAVGMRAKLIGMCWVKSDLTRFVPASKEQALGNMGAKGLNRVFNKCAEMNGLSEEAQKAAKENFDSDQNENSTSD